MIEIIQQRSSKPDTITPRESLDSALVSEFILQISCEQVFQRLEKAVD